MSDYIEIQIDALTYGGRGIGRHNGKAVFVPHVLPGELVRCRVVHEKKRYCEAELVSILQSSDDRRAPPCRFFPECGGCQWQHLNYRGQLFWKEKIFFDTLIRSTGCSPSLFLPIIAAPEEMGYRSRTQIKCRMSKGGLVAGFYRAGTHRIVDTDNCLILDRLLPPLLERFRDCVAGFSQASMIRQADFSVDSAGQPALVVHFDGDDTPGLKKSLSELSNDLNVSLYLSGERNTQLTRLSKVKQQWISPEDDGVLHLAFPPGGFTQINLQQNRQLVREVLKGAVQSGQESVLDLYSGIGNFALPLARICSEVVGVEEYLPAVEMARQNAHHHKLDNLSFIVGRSENVISQLFQSTQFDSVVLDPPRNGALQAFEALLKFLPERIVYVSCDPTTMARDLSLMLGHRYELISAQPVDMFPQTYHIEGIAVLQRR